MANPFKIISKMFKKDKKHTGVGRVHRNNLDALYNKMKIENDRRRIYEECFTMYKDDSRIAAAIDTTAGSATNGAYTIKFNNTSNIPESVLNDAEEIIERVNYRTKVKQNILSIAKEFLILGDVFLEVVIDFENNEIAALKKLPAKTIERIEDDFGILQGFVQKNDVGQTIAEFEPWQILHMRYNHFSGNLYGVSMIRGVISAYKKLRMTEEDLVVRRRTRAGVKLHHYGADPSEPLDEGEVDEYMEINESTPLNVRTDFYSNGKWKIDVLKSDDGVSMIDDIKHLENSLFIGLRTPKGLLGIGEETNKATLERQEVSYIRLLNEITGDISEQLKQVYDLALTIKGINPYNINYELVWQEKTIEDTQRKTERLILQANGGFIAKQTATEEMGYNFEDEMNRIEKESEKWKHIDFNQTKFVDPKSIMQSAREKVKHQKRTDDGIENQKTKLEEE